MLRSEANKNSMVLSSLMVLAKATVIAVSVVMVIVTLSQVVFRYVLTAPLPWSEELARYCFVWIVFLGAAIGLERGIHLGVDLFVNLLPRRLRTGLDVLSNALIGGLAIAIIYASFPVIEMNFLQRSPAMGVQMSWIYIAIPIAMALIVVICIERIAKTIRGGSGQDA